MVLIDAPRYLQMNIKLNSLMVFIFLLFTGNTIFACQCYSIGKINKEVFNHFQLIAKGEVLKIDTIDFELIINIKVMELYHGKADSVIQVNSYLGGAACGLSIRMNETWLIFAFFNEDKLETNLCTRSQNLNNSVSIVYDTKVLKNDLKFLNNHLKKQKKYLKKHT